MINLKQLRLEIAANELLKNREILNTYGPFVTRGQMNKKRQIRKQKIKYLQSLGVKSYDNNRKLFTGELSPGCEYCRNGQWGCLYINHFCTRDCFFCLIGKKESKWATLEGFLIKNEKDLIKAFRLLGLKACGISGGEPLLVLNKTARFISAMRKNFGPCFWIHLYTNGDLINYRNLKILKDAGLDEIRFNLAANGYSLKPVEKALKVFPKTIIEIPVIPKDEKKLYALLVSLDKLGAPGINLHELAAKPINLSKVKKLGYSIENEEVRPIYLDNLTRKVKGSEELAFRLLEFAVKKRLSLSVHYCSTEYKFHIQIPRRMKKVAQINKRPHEVIDKYGAIEKIVTIKRDKRNRIIRLKMNPKNRQIVEVSNLK